MNYYNTQNMNKWWLSPLSIISIVLAGTDKGVYFSPDVGLNWTSAGLNDFSITSLLVTETNVFAGTIENNLWKRPIPQVITGVKEILRHQLSYDIFPNPAKDYVVASVENTDLVIVMIFNSIGIKVLEKKLSSNEEKINFDLPNGIYFISINGNTKKLIISK